MATFAGTAAPINDTDANFRAWINIIHSVMTVSGGWIQTGDTGQINFTTAARPGAANTKVGYAVYRMDDSLQSTKPVYLKLAFGSGAAQNTPGVWFSLGSKTDGAGNFVDANDGDRAALYFDQYSQTAPAITTNGNNATVRECFGSAGTDRVVWFMFEAKPVIQDTSMPKTCSNISVLTGDSTGAESNYNVLFSVERARGWDGATVGDSIIVMWAGVNARLAKHIYLPLDHTLAPLSHVSGMTYFLPYQATAVAIHPQYIDCLLVSGGTVSAPIPFKRNTYPMPPGVNIMTGIMSYFKFSMGGFGVGGCLGCTGVETGAYITGRTVGISPYGTSRTYRTCAGMRMSNFLDSGQDSSAFVYILYE